MAVIPTGSRPSGVPPGWADAGSAGSFPLAPGSVRGAPGGAVERGRGGRREAGEAGGRFYCSLRPPPPTPRPGVTGKPPEPPGGGLFIERAARASRSPARLTGPLTRLAAGPCPRGCASGAGDNGLLCVQLPPPLGAEGGGLVAAPRAPSLPPPAPRKVAGLFCPWPGPAPASCSCLCFCFCFYQ